MRDGVGSPEVCSEDGGRDDQQGDGGETAAGQQGRVRKQSAYLQQLLLVNKAESGNSPHIYNSSCFQLASRDSCI